ncbi:sensor histidine kinase [Pedobacter boryungensis]|uniref:Oxygen sensor histidine kinase NreB n=1 Tax=Pedobacter boryungensis TaxID=869962 RepID=A0ABX2DGA0_9SPHI|nr:ATP-binding protein [Pedobacter boryungensis]NQX33137.1 hypothetical protein [Pedobacter boryungensis]
MSTILPAQTPGSPPPLKDISEIKLMPASIDKVTQLVRYCRNPKMVYSDELKVLLEESLQYTREAKRDELTVSLLSVTALVELGLGNQENAVKYIKQAETYLGQLPERAVVNVLSDLTRVYTRIGDNEKSSFYNDKLEAFTKDKPQFIIPRVLNLRNRANLDLKAGNNEKLKPTYELALKLAKESNNVALLKDTRFAYANALLSVRKDDEAFSILKDLIPDLDNAMTDRTGLFFEILSRNYEKNGDYKNAFIYAEKTFNLPNATTQQKGNGINKMINLSFLLKNYSNFESYYAEHKKFGMDQNSLHSRKQYQLAESRYFDAKENHKLAKANYLKAFMLKMAKQYTPNIDVEILTGLSNIYAREGKSDSASFYFKKAQGLIKKYSMPPATRLIYANALKNFSQYNTVGQDTLIKNLEQEMHLKDTLYHMSLSKITNELETKYRVNEKEKELALTKKQKQVQELELNQQKQRNLLIIIGATIVVLLLGGIAYIIAQRKKQAILLHDATLSDLKKQHHIDLMNTLTDAQEEEKKRIAGRLHDEVGAMLSIAKLNINTLQDNLFVADSDAENKLKTTKNLMNDISETVRNISHTLMPIALEKYGFKAAILDLLTNIKAANSLHVEHVIEGLDDTKDWPQNFILSAYRIIQEIVNNTIKHAQATHLFVQIIELENAITIYIEDNGKGIPNENTETTGVGMKLLQTNIAYLSGKLEIKGEPNAGTFALIELPIPKTTTL